MTFTPQIIDNTAPGESLRSGADKINRNFNAVILAIEEAMVGVTYLDPVVDILSAAPTEGLTVGERYIVDTDVSEGDPWENQADKIAELTSDSPYTWEFTDVATGYTLIVESGGCEYIYSNNKWNKRAVLTPHNSLSGIDGSTYHVTKDAYDALAGTGTPSVSNKFVTENTISIIDGGDF